MFAEDISLKQWIWLKKTISSTCMFYTFFVTALYLLGVYVDSHWVPTLQMILSLLLFSFVLSAANTFLFSDRLIFSLRFLIHFVITTAVFYTVFVLWGGFQANGGSVLAALFVYLFVYLLAALLVFMYRYLTSELRISEKKYEKAFDGKESYQSQFSNKK